MPRYNPAVIEPKWQQFWETHATFQTPELPQGEKLYVLDMFPYPSGNGLHVGHPEGYTATDILCRAARMQGKTVLHPMGFDAFGLPAEEFAIKTNTPPRESTEKNIDTFRRQLKMLGFSYDWDREVATTDVDYFRWTQWIFLQLYDTWFDKEQQKGRAIAELPIPADVQAEGPAAVQRYQDEHRLAYQADALVNWCPNLGTVLANEEVQDGKSERGGHPVVRIPLRQWTLRITAYADRLESDLELLNWPRSVKKLQSDWIGRSTGAEVDFYIGAADDYAAWKKARAAQDFPAQPGDDALRIYTTRPDTLYGATYMVIAPEHPFVERLTTPENAAAVKAYCDKAAGKSDRERQEEKKKKTGVFTGSYALNPVNGEPTPVWIADYVLISYGSGAIMAVPAHDIRDLEFAQQFDLPVTAVVDPGPDAEDRDQVLAGEACFAGHGVAVHSGDYDGLSTADFKVKIAGDLAAAGMGSPAVNYKLRDWLFSRQRFWGEPFPILHELDENDQPTGVIRTVDEADLPVNLPHLDDFKPPGTPEPPLGKAPHDWLYQTIDGVRYRRETNTMPQWAGSCWYYLRYIDPKNSECFVDPAKEKAWMPVDVYIGGVEHAVLHLLYARFWHKVLFDRGHVSTPEPFQRLINQGMILGEPELNGYQTSDGQWVSAADAVVDEEQGAVLQEGTGAALSEVKLEPSQVEKKGDSFVLVDDPSIRIDHRAFKMSKSRGNVVTPDEVVSEYGADSLRLYEMFMGPLEATKPWSMNGVSGVKNFLDRVWRLIVDDRAEEMTLSDAVQDVEPTADQNRIVHKTIQAVTSDIAGLSFNTAIARMMEFVNAFTREKVRPKQSLETLVLLLSPYAPHIAEELWSVLGHADTLAYESWPEFNEELAADSTIEIPVQILGKVRAKLQAAPDISQADLEQAALADPKIAEMLAGKTIVKTIVIPGRLVNFVVK
ncbi:leucine--tRNA ligase [Lignipirellula cremea]|uniref:Leucine--tRNA ligase n=1 Tax=Lignipirellula cremea TaxID=2528010 RepID=A0A518DRX7_9BACT|nr:leucine--tRNA ligase [Lignipirellula cremea]QDU94597.1 Leucine--tRNA ligase [Lignipirellula cremea]